MIPLALDVWGRMPVEAQGYIHALEARIAAPAATAR